MPPVRPVTSVSCRGTAPIRGVASGGSQTNVIVHHLFTPGTTEIVAAGESFHLELGSFANDYNGFCQAVVICDTDG